MPKIKHPMAFADKSRAVDHVRSILDDRLNEPRILGRGVFQIGVLDDDHVSGGMSESLPEGRPFTAIMFVKENSNLIARHLAENFAGPIGAAVVDQNDFLGDGHLAHALDRFTDPLFLVINGNDHRKLESLGQWIDSELPASADA